MWITCRKDGYYLSFGATTYSALGIMKGPLRLQISKNVSKRDNYRSFESLKPFFSKVSSIILVSDLPPFMREMNFPNLGDIQVCHNPNSYSITDSERFFFFLIKHRNTLTNIHFSDISFHYFERNKLPENVLDKLVWSKLTYLDITGDILDMDLIRTMVKSPHLESIKIRNTYSKINNKYHGIRYQFSIKRGSNKLLETLCSVKRSKLQCLSLVNCDIEGLPNTMSNLTNLTYLGLDINHLRIIPEAIRGLKGLNELSLDNNYIETIPSWLSEIETLTEFSINSNQITTFPILPSLEKINLNNNSIGEIPIEIDQMVNLERLNICNNKITTIPVEITTLHNFNIINYHENEIIYLPPQVERFLLRIQDQYHYGTVYNDAQNVHNTMIQKCFRESMNRLTRNKPALTFPQTMNEIESSTLKGGNFKKLTAFCECDEVVMGLNLTISEVIVAVWDRIRNHKDREEIINVLNIEIQDAKNMCFTGRVTRIVNCLCGFDSDVVMNISDSEQISNIINMLKIKYPDDESLEKLREEFKGEMKERGYNDELIEEWAVHIE